LQRGGFCTLQARPDSVRLVIYSGWDVMTLLGSRFSQTIAGTYRIQNGTAFQGSGEWNASLDSGPPIPPRLNPW